MVKKINELYCKEVCFTHLSFHKSLSSKRNRLLFCAAKRNESAIDGNTKNMLRGTFYAGSENARVCEDTSRTRNAGQASLAPRSVSLWLMGMHTPPQGQRTAHDSGHTGCAVHNYRDIAHNPMIRMMSPGA